MYLFKEYKYKILGLQTDRVVTYGTIITDTRNT